MKRFTNYFDNVYSLSFVLYLSEDVFFLSSVLISKIFWLALLSDKYKV